MGYMGVRRTASAASLLSHGNSSGYLQAKSSAVTKMSGKVEGKMKDKSSGWKENFMLMIQLRKMILIFRDVIDLPPCNGSIPIHELIMATVEDLHNLYRNVVPCSLTPEMEEISIHQGLVHLHKALRSVQDSWAKDHRWITNLGDNAEDCLENLTLEQLGERVLAKLKDITDIAKEMFDVMDEDEKNNEEGRTEGSITGDILSESYSDHKNTCPSPDSPNSIPPELTFAMSYSQPHLLPLRLQALGNLQPIGVKCLSTNTSPPSLSHQGSSPMKAISKIDDELGVQIEDVAQDTPVTESYNQGLSGSKAVDDLTIIPNFDPNVIPEGSKAPPPSPSPLSTTLQTIPPALPSLPINANAAVPPLPIPSSKVPVPVPVPVPPMPLAKGVAPPPPPPLGVTKALRPKKATTKLKRSSHMGSLYRVLKGKVEGSGLNGKQSHGRKSQIGGSSGGKQGMADALAEMARRSAYFQQIQEDVEKHSKSIMEVKAAINSFKTKDMNELIEFHKYVEQHLEKLSDETQVLARFEGFPTKKLESLRTAAALHLKLEGTLTNLKNWKLELPLCQLLDKVECYFSKIKGEVDALERSKDEDSKRFQSHNIHFDFTILVRLKESMVDVSSSCMELVLKERREAKAATSAGSGSRKHVQAKAHTKMLWKAFQFAFRVYSFAGGQDDRADELTKELAHEIETDPQEE